VKADSGSSAWGQVASIQDLLYRRREIRNKNEVFWQYSVVREREIWIIWQAGRVALDKKAHFQIQEG